MFSLDLGGSFVRCRSRGEVIRTSPANGAPMISIATDYVQGTGNPYPYLQAIAEAGFTHIHWCHQWNTDFLYATPEIDQIERWLDELGLKVTDLHASAGREKAWASVREYERLAGVELVANRMEMTARLGSDAIVLHFPGELAEEPVAVDHWDAMWRSAEALAQHSQATGVRIAFENLSPSGSWRPIAAVLSEYGPEVAGLCYDSGHGNISGDGLDQLATHADRLIAIHLHDNDASGDQHKLPFMGTIDWDRLVGLIAGSSYEKWVNVEVSQERSGYEDTATFLRDARAVALRLTDAIDACREEDANA